jgi:hypothetical protein
MADLPGQRGELDKLAAKLRPLHGRSIVPLVADVRDRASVDEAFKEVGRCVGGASAARRSRAWAAYVRPAGARIRNLLRTHPLLWAQLLMLGPPSLSVHVCALSWYVCKSDLCTMNVAPLLPWP